MYAIFIGRSSHRRGQSEIQLQLSSQFSICAPGTHYCWVYRCNVDSKLAQCCFCKYLNLPPTATNSSTGWDVHGRRCVLKRRRGIHGHLPPPPRGLTGVLPGGSVLIRAGQNKLDNDSGAIYLVLCASTLPLLSHLSCQFGGTGRRGWGTERGGGGRGSCMLP